MRRRAAFVAAALVTWVAGSALGTTPIPHAVAQPFMTIGAAHSAQLLPALDGKKPVFILALGTDTRKHNDIGCGCADSIHLIGINPRKRNATVLGFPRDSWVEIPGLGMNKINTALHYGGPKLMVQTIEAITGIHIDFYVLTTFGGLTSMVNSVGGVTVDVPYPMHDHYSGADFEPGSIHMNGKQALSFARDRHDVPNGDLSRSSDQGILFLSALAEFRADFDKSPSSLLTWMGAGLRNIETDLPLDEMLKLAFTAAEVKPAKVKNLVVPATVGTVGAASVVFISSSAKDIYANMRDDGLDN
jgi:LCP family protein required for cell wall assembly